MNSPEYFISLWDSDLYTLVDSPRTTGNYMIQGCDISINLDQDELDNVSFTNEAGLRIYENDDATDFYTTPEPPFNYYQKELEYSSDLEEVPVYAPEKQKAVPKEEKVHTLDIAAITEAFGTDKINEWEQAYTAAQAPVDNTVENVAVNSWRQTVPDPTVTITTSYGYTKYELLTESDWMYWWIAVEMPTTWAVDGEILYTYVTVNPGTETEEIYTAACQTAFGSETYDVAFFKQEDDLDALSSTNTDYVIG